MDEPTPPDAFEKRLRFGCGFLFGGLAAFFFALQQMAAFTGTFWAVVAGAAMVFGLLAVRYGDAWWHGILSLFRWF